MIEEKISYESRKEKLPAKKMVASSRDEYLELLSPVYSEKQLQDLDIDDLKDLLDEVIDRAYKVKLNSGGPVKPLEYLELSKQIQTMSEEEKENLQYMLNQLLNKAKDKK
tara:strand:+ start:365 stop:694 length:330 start_codon:yes stop_codon:yes gene_type:complete